MSIDRTAWALSALFSGVALISFESCIKQRSNALPTLTVTKTSLRPNAREVVAFMFPVGGVLLVVILEFRRTTNHETMEPMLGRIRLLGRSRHNRSSR